MKKVLVVAAHPDDDILGCGGVFAKRRASTRFRVVFLAEGSSCRYPVGEIAGAESRAAIAQRTAAARKALGVVGITDVRFCDYPCGRLDTVPILDLNKVVEAELAAFDPDTVLTHSEFDTNNDHRIVSRSVSMATRPGGLHHVPTVMAFEVQSSTEWNFVTPFAPDHFEVLSSEQVSAKWEALACYDSETRAYPHPRSKEGVEALARYRGLQAGVAFAEAFRTIRTIVP